MFVKTKINEKEAGVGPFFLKKRVVKVLPIQQKGKFTVVGGYSLVFVHKLIFSLYKRVPLVIFNFDLGTHEKGRDHVEAQGNVVMWKNQRNISK